MSADGRSILIVEDDGDVRDALSWVLADAGYTVRTAENGRIALQLLRDEPSRPSAILLDLMMPVMDGWQFRAAQLADPKIAAIPVICITAHPDAERTSKELAARAWLQKPLELPVLLAAVERVSV